MSTDEEMIAAVRAMKPEELNTFVAMKLTAIIYRQEECNRTCLARLDLMQGQVEAAQKQAQDAQVKVARLFGWMKGIWIVLGGIFLATIAYFRVQNK